jgi:hypothetical protein
MAVVFRRQQPSEDGLQPADEPQQICGSIASRSGKASGPLIGLSTAGTGLQYCRLGMSGRLIGRSILAIRLQYRR